ncbi:hypothetical protein ACH414_28555 [Streptomyces sp. NPDC020422]|uniref:hypothetical protein n=1 Tax=unclassified Streptomyces TaxID=2593676 RepID=UPI003701E15B
MKNRTTLDQPVPGHAVLVDLRAGAYAPRHADADAEAAVHRALDTPQPDGERRFLVVDDADRLVAHQLLYERLSSYGPAQIVCLAIGAPGERTLRRSLTLGPPAAGVLWLLDDFRGAGAGALRPLVDVLATPEVFDAVLGRLGRIVYGVAVPSVRVLEHDLTDEARERAWRQALEALTGPDVPTPASIGQVPGELALLLDESVPRSLAGHAWLPGNGRAGSQLSACEDALDEVIEDHARVRGPAGLFGPAGRDTDLPGGIEHLGQALARFRTTVADTFAIAGSTRPTVEERGLLRDRGVQLPEMPREITRTGIVPALRDHTHELIGRRLPLRSVAARLTALAARTAPAGSAARLARLDAICGPVQMDRLTAQYPFLAGGSRPLAALVTGVLAALGGLWAGAGWVLGPAVGVLAASLALLMLRRRPNRSPDGRLDGGASTGSGPRLFGGLVGGLAGAGAGSYLALPLWVGALAFALAVTVVLLLALRDWTRGVDDWWDRADPEGAGRILKEIQALLVTTAVHDWLFADVRHHCSDGAGAVARLLKGLAATAEASGGQADPSPYAGAPRTREAGGTVPPPRRAEQNGWDWDDADDDGDYGSWAGGSPAGGASAAGTPAGGGASGESWAGTGSSGDTWSGPMWSDDTATGDTWSGDTRAAPGPRAPGPHGPGPHPAGATPRRGAPAPAAQAPAEAPAPKWLERRYGDGGPALVDTLSGDLFDGVVALLDTCWAGIERDPGNAGRVPLDEPMNALLDETRTRLERDAAASPPPGRERGDRPDAARLTGVSPDAVARLIAADDDPRLTVPLCGPEHLRLLSHERTARRVRFVPETMRRGATGDDIWWGAVEDVVWTDSGRHAGVLRLVPLRKDVVRTVREEEGGAP